MFRGIDIRGILISLPVILLALSVHEFSHGYVAYKLGDPTARDEGRLTINPIAHIDPIGALAMILMGFGWARPVPVNPMYFKNRKQGMALVSLAGPLSNLIMAALTAVAYAFFIKYGGGLNPTGVHEIITLLFQLTISLNVGFAVFNLIPIPPLDGSKILASVLPDKYYYNMLRYERYAFPILMILLFFGVLTPLLSAMRGTIIKSLEQLIYFILGF